MIHSTKYFWRKISVVAQLSGGVAAFRRGKQVCFSEKHIDAAALRAGSVVLDVDVTVWTPTTPKNNQKMILRLLRALARTGVERWRSLEFMAYTPLAFSALGIFGDQFTHLQSVRLDGSWVSLIQLLCKSSIAPLESISLELVTMPSWKEVAEFPCWPRLHSFELQVHWHWGYLINQSHTEILSACIYLRYLHLKSAALSLLCHYEPTFPHLEGLWLTGAEYFRDGDKMGIYRLLQTSPTITTLDFTFADPHIQSFKKRIDLPALKLLKFSGCPFHLPDIRAPALEQLHLSACPENVGIAKFCRETWDRSRPACELLKPSHLYLDNVHIIQDDLLELLTFLPQLKFFHFRGTLPESDFFFKLATLCPDLQAVHLVKTDFSSSARASLPSTLREIAAARSGLGSPLYSLSCQYDIFDRNSTEQYC